MHVYSELQSPVCDVGWPEPGCVSLYSLNWESWTLGLVQGQGILCLFIYLFLIRTFEHLKSMFSSFRTVASRITVILW